MPSDVLLHEGYLKWLPPQGDTLTGALSPQRIKQVAKFSLHSSPSLVERYCELVGRQLFMYTAPDKKQRTGSYEILGFCQWDGDGNAKVGSYGIQLKTGSSVHDLLFVAAFNRLDLENWCKALLAAIDPRSDAAEDLRRQRRKERRAIRKEEKRREEEQKMWAERRRLLAEKEAARSQQREAEIQNMTPLERADGLGTLDEDTARILEKRRQRRQRRQAPTTGRVKRTAYRRRIDEAAGGRVDNMQPLTRELRSADPRQRAKVIVPPPGQFIEVSGSYRRKDTNRKPQSMASPRPPAYSDEEDSDSSRSSPDSEAYRNRRHPSSSESEYSESESDGFSPDERVIPPRPRPPARQASSASTIPPPPPPDFDEEEFVPPPPPTSPPSSRVGRSDSFMSSASSRYSLQSNAVASNLSNILSQRQQAGPDTSTASVYQRGFDERSRAPSVASIKSIKSSNPMQANLAAILRESSKKLHGQNEGPLQQQTSRLSISQDREQAQAQQSPQRDRIRKKQLSAEGKDLFKDAMTPTSSKSPKKVAPASKRRPANGRKGLFDSSSEEEEDTKPFARDTASPKKTSVFSSDSEPASPPRRQIPSALAQAIKTASPKKQEDPQLPKFALSSEDEISSPPRMNSALARAIQNTKQPSGNEFDSTSTRSSPKRKVSNASSFQQPTPRSTSGQVASGSSLSPVFVQRIANETRTDRKKPYTVYTFRLQVKGCSHEFTFSYHEMSDIHSRLTISRPKFPSKHLLKNNLKPEFIARRALELQAYFEELLRNPAIRSSERFHFEYRIPREFVDAMNSPSDSSSTTRASSASRAMSPPPSGRAPSRTMFDEDSDEDSDKSAETPEPKYRKKVASKKSTAAFSSPTSAAPRATRGMFSDSSVDSPKSPPRKERGSSSKRRPTSTASTKSTKSVKTSGEPPKPQIEGIPNRPNPFGGGRGDLMAAIRKGKTLQSADDSDATHGRSNLLAAIRTGKTLTSTQASAAAASSPILSPTAVNPAPVSRAPMSIGDAISSAMAERRVHVEAEDEDSDDDSEDWN